MGAELCKLICGVAGSTPGSTKNDMYFRKDLPD